MSTTIKALFPGRREVELAVEHLVQEYGIERTDIFIEPAGSKNSAGDQPAGADVASGQNRETPDASGAAYEGQLVVSVDMNEDEGDAVTQAFREAGAVEVACG
ncbi:hypothetical protein [Novosphingobium resinovorum]|uniref:Uncharacterized protein n=1 Tax=Novosphingobium resinovorum TaxID=158500 RepID=A0A031JRG9_9SPHN|nr:hypothetical protein [Novosphingobium resinovorum]AOR79431.1 hypothetical protein BES08_21610 [Novosphingobium resinovorum]EZP79373.1 hypothetical protein BV97_04040 [Novosphingobium resinovorum]